ncbi:DUF507 family protein [Candidatus Fermentibacteria bacterium]|nr:DUF507 family protein [Candidatus Fermentibacteria bacterium]
MRLSEERVHVLAAHIVQKLVEAEAVVAPDNENLLKQRVAAWIIDDLKTEDEIDREARRILRSLSRPPEEGSEEWDIKLRQTRDDLAQRRGYAL